MERLSFPWPGVGTQAPVFAPVNEHFGGALLRQSPKQTLINTFINSPLLAEMWKEVKKVKSWDLLTSIMVGSLL